MCVVPRITWREPHLWPRRGRTIIATGDQREPVVMGQNVHVPGGGRKCGRILGAPSRRGRRRSLCSPPAGPGECVSFPRVSLRSTRGYCCAPPCGGKTVMREYGLSRTNGPLPDAQELWVMARVALGNEKKYNLGTKEDERKEPPGMAALQSCADNACRGYNAGSKRRLRE